MREDLNARAQRRMAVLDPVQLVIDNYPEGGEENCFAPNHPQRPELDKRALPFSRELWIERDDYQEDAPQGYFRLAPGAEVRLRYALHRPLRRRREGCRRQGRSRSIAPTIRQRDPARRAPMRARCSGNIHWLSSRARAAGGSAALRPAVRGAVSRDAPSAGRDVPTARAGAVAHATVVAGDDVDDDGAEARRAQLARRSQSGQQARDHGATSSLALGSTRGGRSVPVRAARILRRGSARPRAGQACLQSHGDAQGFVGAAVAAPLISLHRSLRRSSRAPSGGHDGRCSRAARIAVPARLPRGRPMKRIVLFLATNLAVVLVLSVVLKLLGLDRAMYYADGDIVRRPARIRGGRRLHGLDHLAADVEADGEMVDRRPRDRAAVERAGSLAPRDGAQARHDRRHRDARGRDLRRRAERFRHRGVQELRARRRVHRASCSR